MTGPDMTGPDMAGPDKDRPGTDAGLPTMDVLANEPQGPQRRASWWIVVAVTAVVAVLIGGVTYGVASLSGGGAQPADALPPGAVAFAQVDLDPPAGQKIDAYRFLRKFPGLRDRMAGDDLRKALFESVAEGAGWQDVDFDTDVAPWLGRRVGVGVYPAGSLGVAAGASHRVGARPVVVVALQVTDDDKARRGLDHLLDRLPGSAATPGDRPGYVFAGGYALLAERQQVASAAADRAGDGGLASSSSFTEDMAGLGDGFAAAWFDGRAIGHLLPSAGALGLSPLVGLGGLPGVPGLGGLNTAGGESLRTAVVLRFDGPDVVELAGHVTGGATAVPGGDVRLTGLDDLPASTSVAVGLAGAGELVDALWDALTSRAASGDDDPVADRIKAAEQASGLHLPDDLELLLGSNLLVALDRAGLGDGDPALGVRAVTRDPARADALLDRVGGGVLEANGTLHRPTADGYALATSDAQLRRLTTEPGERLADVPAFSRTLPDLDTARFAAWVDLPPLAQALVGRRDGSLPGDLRPLLGAGATASSDGHGGSSFRVRLATR